MMNRDSFEGKDLCWACFHQTTMNTKDKVHCVQNRYRNRCH